MALNFYRNKTFVVFKSVNFEIFQIFLQIIIGIEINTFLAFFEKENRTFTRSAHRNEPFLNGLSYTQGGR